MAAANTKTVAWSECEILVGDAGTATASFTSIGVIKDKSAEMTTSEGDTLELKSTGGHTVAYEKQEGTATITCRVIEPDKSFFSLFGIVSSTGTGDTLEIKSLIPDSEKSVKIVPKNIGAYGVIAPFCSVSISTGWNESEGNYADVTFGILCKVPSGESTFWYKMVKKTAPSA